MKVKNGTKKVKNSEKMGDLLAEVRLWLLLASFAALVTCKEDCPLYLAPNKYGYGRGVYAGADTARNEYPITTAPTLLVNNNHLYATSLNNYVFQSEDENYNMVVFGPSQLMNHLSSIAITEHYWDVDNISTASESTVEPYSSYSTISWKTTTNISVGEEITTTYGDQEWFSSRGIHDTSDALYQNNKNDSGNGSGYLLDELKESGFCLSDVYISPSTIPLAGKGVFASRNFDIGEIVSISPVVLMSKDKLVPTLEDSVLVNYCFAHPDSDIFILPLHLTALINHNYLSNVNISWYENKKWKEAMGTAHIVVDTTPVEYIVDQSFAALDIQYVATKPIQKNEEIYINYGDVWINNWAEYLARRIQVHLYDQSPTFRYPIYVEGLYPPHWKLPHEVEA